jgi:hypothetical protein
MMKFFALTITLVLFCTSTVYAQQKNTLPDSSDYQVTGKPLSPKDSLRFFERRLIGLGESIIMAQTEEERFVSTYNFARTLIGALKLPNSFEYPFDSV